MKQVVQSFKTGELKVDDVPPPLLKGKGVLVQNYYSVISAGTERSTILVGKSSLIAKAKQKPEQVKLVLDAVKKEGLISTYKKIQKKLDEPKALGYSSAGRIIAVSEEITDLKIGDLVACGGQNYASHAEIIFIPRNLVCKIPNDISVKEAAFSTMGSIAMQGVRLCKAELGHKVAVIGMGLLGNFAVQLFSISGCEVVAIDISPQALDGINKYGASLTINSDNQDVERLVENFTDGFGLDSVLITAGTTSNAPIKLAGKICRKKGRVVVTGAVRMDIPREEYFKKEIEVVISSSYGPGRYDPNYEEIGNDYPYHYVRFTENRNFSTFLSLLKSKKLNLSGLITHEFDILEAGKAYDLILGKKDEFFKAILLKYKQDDSLKRQQAISLSKVKRNKLLGIGFIGAGSHAQNFLLPAVKSAKLDMIAVCTRSGINAKNIANKYQFTICTTNQSDVTENEMIDVVFIATRHNNHASLTIEALKNAKHVFVEKPLAMTQKELDDIKTVYSDLKIKPHLMIGFNRRFSALSIRLKEKFSKINEPLIVNYRINAGFIPKDHWIYDSGEGGGRIIGEICHFIDYSKFVIASSIVSVYAKSIHSDNSSNKNEDNIILTLSFKNGSIAVITYFANGDKSVPKERIEVTGGNVYAILDDFQTLSLFENAREKRIKIADKGQKKCVSLFLKQVMKKEALILSEDLFEVTEATFNVIRSLKKQQVINQ